MSFLETLAICGNLFFSPLDIRQFHYKPKDPA